MHLYGEIYIYIPGLIHIYTHTHIYIYIFAGQLWRRRYRVQTCGHRKEGEGGMNLECSTETYTLPYVKLDSRWKFAVWRRELNLVLCENPEEVGWGGR